MCVDNLIFMRIKIDFFILISYILWTKVIQNFPHFYIFAEKRYF